MTYRYLVPIMIIWTLIGAMIGAEIIAQRAKVTFGCKQTAMERAVSDNLHQQPAMTVGVGGNTHYRCENPTQFEESGIYCSANNKCFVGITYECEGLQ